MKQLSPQQRELLASLVQQLAKVPGIAAIVLGGSHARGRGAHLTFFRWSRGADIVREDVSRAASAEGLLKSLQFKAQEGLA